MDMMKCYILVYESLGITDASDGLTDEDLQKVEGFWSHLFSGPTGICS